MKHDFSLRGARTIPDIAAKFATFGLVLRKRKILPGNVSINNPHDNNSMVKSQL